MARWVVCGDALAAVAVAGTAVAQVTISGRLDMGANHAKTTDKLSGASTKTKANDSTGAQNSRTTSRITFAGTEDLGGGLKAGFAFETGLNSSDDDAVFAGSTRQGSISLMSDLGTFSIGTFSVNSLQAIRDMSAHTFGAVGGDAQNRTMSGSQANALRKAAGGDVGLLDDFPVWNSAKANTNNTNEFPGTIGLLGRSRNAVSYVTPNFNGFQASLGLVQQRGISTSIKTDDPEYAGNKWKGKGQLLGASYIAGPLTVRAAIGSQKTTELDGDGKLKNTNNSIGASYNLGVAVPYFIHESGKAKFRDGYIKAKSTEVGARIPMGAFTPYALVTTGSHKTDAGKLAKSSGYQVGTTYDLSKRTFLYASMGSDTIKGAGDLKAAKVSSKRTGYAAGIVHNF